MPRGYPKKKYRGRDRPKKIAGLSGDFPNPGWPGKDWWDWSIYGRRPRWTVPRPGGMGAPPPPPPPPGGGGGGGAPPPEGPPPPKKPKKIKWSPFDFQAPGAPDWWKAMKPNKYTEETQYLASVNMMIPFLSPEDQRTVAAQLYITNPEHFGHLNPELLGAPPLSTAEGKYGWITREQQRQYYMGAERAELALGALTSLLEASGKKEKDLGTGYAYLKSLVSTVGQYGAEKKVGVSGMTRMQYQRMLAALDPLLGMTEGQTLSPYGPIAKAFVFPYLTSGELVPYSQREGGGYMFGKPIPKFRF